MFQTVLIANRGEIAVRIIRTLRRLGIRSVAVYSDADAQAPHVRAADVALRIGPARAAESYLNIDRVIDAAVRLGAEAIHPGYGFLSENAGFAAACAAAGLTYIGPDPRATEIMGDKISAKQRVEADGVAGIPGRAEPGMTDEQLISAADEIGYPVLVKPSAGGGGKGMIDVHRRDDVPDAVATARRIARAAFGDDTLFLEKLITSPRHIEVQILADTRGNVIHLGERECSLQRRHQKVIEEAPSSLLDTDTRARIGAAACDVARSVDYTGAGTVEFLVSADAPEEFFFMEMNTRLQVEHPVTEQVTGIDLVEQQLLIAAGEPLSIAQDDVTFTGHAVEARLYAEDAQFLPQAGTVEYVSFPDDVRVDSGIAAGTTVSADYDPMLAKIIAHDSTRGGALERLGRALDATVVFGVTTKTSFLRDLVDDDSVRRGTMDTTTIDRRVVGAASAAVPERVWLTAALAAHDARWNNAGRTPWASPSGWRLGAPPRAIETRMRHGDDERRIAVSGRPENACVDGQLAAIRGSGHHRLVTVDGETVPATILRAHADIWVHDGQMSRCFHLVERDSARETRRHADASEPELRSPMPGTVVAVPVASGDNVDAGDTVLVIEAMKMEHRITAPAAGTVTLAASLNQTVAKDAIVATIAAADPAVSAEPSHEDARHRGDDA
ncbi:acetyl/propionyl/methylcrotonyl-CoA carboxylase subunit alpha [Paramicrobacterium agarici]|uniref:acetyl/propionyl/methylcrotonyl-CoA carboxylase subunit alpha n=1 Tax=Paramicrobacterium agarici TaxID=630514 RepID=UPI00114F83B7|nr:biotin carboxylase N-terminal domain-containing protein [Microbacterium agarici]TQO24089.1 acetyl-CoA/propionyl-CoA carboxylase biotin carboxyl carrier protein [Microbacterium agarici]